MIYLKEVDSTNKYIKEHVSELDSFECVFTDNQTEGKGRTGHTWLSEPRKNATFSILVKDKDINTNFNIISIVTGLVVAEYLDMLGLNNVTIKWPNDVYVNGYKICGILLEGQLPNYLIIGIGINVNQKNFEGLAASSIYNEIGIRLDTKLVASDIAEYLITKLKNVNDKLSKEDLDEFILKDYLAGTNVTFTYKDERKKGLALGINEDGSYKIIFNEKILSINSDEINTLRKTENS